MDFLEFAEHEIRMAKLFSKEGDFYGGMTGKALMELCKVFDNQGHSGMSASVVANLFKRLTEWQPLTPLTGEDDEWVDVADDVWQNKRAPSVFRDKINGESYQADYFIFVDENDCTFTSHSSRKYIKFPYNPDHEYIRQKDDPTKWKLIMDGKITLSAPIHKHKEK